MKQAACTLFLRNGELLTVKPRKRPTFQLVGGAVEEGEEILDAAIRECHEELGKFAHFDESKFRFLMEFDEIASSDPNLKIHMNIFIYDGELSGEFTTSDEIGAFMWLRKDDDTTALSNTLRNEIVPYCKENNLIY